MEAIRKLVRAGYTRQEIADGMPGKTGVPLVRLYERGQRFPRKKHYICIVEMAEVRGITLTARDFIDSGERCEPNSTNDRD